MPIDYKTYPPHWNRLRAEILERANGLCEKCGTAAGTRRISIKGSEYDVVLVVSHLDRNEWNHDVTTDRLQAHCQACAFEYDFIDNKIRRKLGKKRYRAMRETLGEQYDPDRYFFGKMNLLLFAHTREVYP